MNSGIMATIRGNPERALVLYEKSRPIFELLKEWQDLAKLWLNWGWTLAGQKRWEEARDLGIEVCMECGTCAFTCPASIPLVQYLRVGKKNVRALPRKEG